MSLAGASQLRASASRDEPATGMKALVALNIHCILRGGVAQQRTADASERPPGFRW